MKMYSQRGRGSAGPRESKRTLNRDEVLGYRDRLMQQPRSPERTAALVKIRTKLASIDRRVTSG